MSAGDGFEKSENASHRARRYLGLVILLLFITAVIGILILVYLTSPRLDHVFFGVRVLSKSSADYSFDEVQQLAPILPGILEDLRRDEVFLTPAQTLGDTPPAVGLIIPTQGGIPIATGAGISPTMIPTAGPTSGLTPAGTTNPGPGPTQVTTLPPTGIPTTLLPTATTGTPTTLVPTATPKTPTPTTLVPTATPKTPTPTTLVPTATPKTPTPTTAVSTTAIPTTAIPTTLTPTTAVVTPSPTTPVPTATSGPTEIPTPWVPPTEEPTPIEETIPGNGLDKQTTPIPPRQLVLPLWSTFFNRAGVITQVCTIEPF